VLNETVMARASLVVSSFDDCTLDILEVARLLWSILHRTARQVHLILSYSGQRI
jgi:hypothetical protein